MFLSLVEQENNDNENYEIKPRESYDTAINKQGKEVDLLLQ